MANLTSKELSALGDQIGFEQTLCKKYHAMACICTDAKLKNEFDAIAQRHQQHYNTLIGFLK